MVSFDFLKIQEYMGKHITVLLLFAMGLFQATIAQIYDPVSWKFTVNQLDDQEVELVFKATIEDNWHLYSQFLPSDDGPIATSFNFDASKHYKRIGKVKEGNAITQFDKVNAMELTFFEHEAVFKQKIAVSSLSSFKVSGYLEFMVCDDEKCLPPESVDFEFNIEPKPVKEKKDISKEVVSGAGLNSSSVTITNGNATSETQIYDPVEWEFTAKKLSEGKYLLQLYATIEKGWHLYSQHLPPDDGPVPTFFHFNKQVGIELIGETEEKGTLISEYDPNFMMELDFFAKEVTFEQTIEVKAGVEKVSGELEFMVCNDKMCLPPELVEFEIALPDVDSIQQSSSSEDITDKSGLELFLLCFLGGLVALFTPCVFPMIPMTVSFFTKQSKTRAAGIRNAIWYAMSIILIYVLLGTVVTAIFGYDSLNILSTNVWFNLFFFVLLVVFAISFMGAFEIVLPSSWVNKVDQASDRGGIIGIFLMAFALAMVSFSCTGPIVGPLLVQSASVGGLGPVIGMFGFSLALALPFGLFAAFPGWLNSLPKSGGWLNTVKVFLGFLELAFAFKFLSNADLVIQAGYLQRELFIAIWIGVFAVLALYLFGFILLPHDSRVERLSVGRTLLGITTVVFVIYLIPGLWGAPLKLISGFPPPKFYSEAPNGFQVGAAVPRANTAKGSGDEHSGEAGHCPHNLPCFHDYDKGLAHAKKVGKPVMLDFTGWACVNCRKMEEQVWSDPRVLKRLRDDFVLVSLYVDEQIDLPAEEQIEVTIGTKTKKLRTVGNKWSYLQASRYETNAQPYYIIMDHSEQTVNGSAAYDPDIDKFLNWLDEGLRQFEAGTED
jgi:thiol:disulfide interchange protein